MCFSSFDCLGIFEFAGVRLEGGLGHWFLGGCVRGLGVVMVYLMLAIDYIALL